MTDCLVGIQKCGCITYVNTRPEHLDRTDEKAIARIVRNGGRIDRMGVDDIRSDPHFLPVECPHMPKGWTYQR